jgi:phospholipid-binding lipoprotein MlaA
LIPPVLLAAALAGAPPEPAVIETIPVTEAQPVAAAEIETPPPLETAEIETPPPLETAEDPQITVTGESTAPDPAEKINLQTYEVVQDVDKAVVGPIAAGYEKVVPKPARVGLRNVLRNLELPVIFLNNVLQLRFKSALKTAGRFAINSTVGVAGLVDVAKDDPFNLPYKQNGFGNTLACYGVGPGPYLYLPLVGPTTLRDVVGLTLDKAALPTIIGPPLDDPKVATPAAVIDSLNDRIEIDEQLQKMREEEGDQYVATRELYFRQRAAEIAETCGKKDVPVDPDLPPRPGKGEE